MPQVLWRGRSSQTVRATGPIFFLAGDTAWDYRNPRFRPDASVLADGDPVRCIVDRENYGKRYSSGVYHGIELIFCRDVSLYSGDLPVNCHEDTTILKGV